MQAKIPPNIRPLEWLVGVSVAMAAGLSAEEAQETVAEAAREMGEKETERTEAEA